MSTTIEFGVSYVQIEKSYDDEDSPDTFADFFDTTEEQERERERPPYIISVHGPPKVGKTLLIKSLVDFFAKSSRDSCDPINGTRVIVGEKRRIQFVECPNNMNGMIDAAKYADAVIFLVDAGYGFEMETFEFLGLLKIHGMPKEVIGVLTYLDSFRNEDVLASTKQSLMDQFQTEIREGAQVFCLSGLDDSAMYLDHQIAPLASYISTMEFHQLSWRVAHTYMLVDNFIDATPKKVQMDKECPREIILTGYLRGCHIEAGTKMHIAGVGDFLLARITSLADPFPVPSDVGIDHAELTCRAGTYVALKFNNVPFEMVKNYDPCQPILVGGITTEEANVGHNKVKLHLHRWHLKELKSKEPIIVSAGWRRYETRPIYARKHRKGDYRVLSHTRRNKPCFVMFWGPLEPVNSGLAFVQSLADKKAAFRFLATAYVTKAKATQIFNESKRIGTPLKICNNTALIKNMFTSPEIALFKDAKIQTESGICGKINKFVGRKEGIAKCTFDKKIRKTETIFMYKPIEVPCFFNPMTTGLVQPPDRIWDCVLDTLAINHLFPYALMGSHHETYVNPVVEPKEYELYAQSNHVKSLERRNMTHKEDIEVVKKARERLNLAFEEWKKERDSKGVLPRRRGVLEQPRGVRFIIESRTQTRTMSSSSTPSSQRLGYGTICVASIDATGFIFASDGRGRQNKETLSDTEDKIHVIGEKMLVSGSGFLNWVHSILDYIRPKVESEGWTCERCAIFVFDVQNKYKDRFLKNHKYLDKTQSCSMIFGSFENNEPKLFFGDNLLVQNVYYDGEIQWRCFGSGCDAATSIIFKSTVPTEFEEKLCLALSAIQNACETSVSCGGRVQVYHMPVPPGVPYIVYERYYQCIQSDKDGFLSDMYLRFYNAAEGGTKMERNYWRLYENFRDRHISEMKIATKRWKTIRKNLDEEMTLLEKEEMDLYYGNKHEKVKPEKKRPSDRDFAS